METLAAVQSRECVAGREARGRPGESGQPRGVSQASLRSRPRGVTLKDSRGCWGVVAQKGSWSGRGGTGCQRHRAYTAQGEPRRVRLCRAGLQGAGLGEEAQGRLGPARQGGESELALV